MSHEAEIFEPSRPSHRRLVGVALGALVVLGALAGTGVVARAQRRATVKEETAASGVPHIQVAKATKSSASGPIVLPGSVQPMQETALFARANGYLRKWNVDIGAEVKKGQVLAELDLPDIDQELRQAKASTAQSVAAVAQAQSQLGLAQTTNNRFAALAGKGVISQQEFDQYTTEVDVRQANLEAARASSTNASANVARIAELRSFGTIVAPFDGVITQRTAEIGQLVQAGTAQGQPLFKVAEDDVVRIFVNVPQLRAGGVKVGNEAAVTVREAPGRTFRGKVARTSRSMDIAARSMLVEVDIPNPERALVSGMYATISLAADRQDALLLIPSTAALVDATGTRVATVQNARIHWQPVEIAADLGDRVAIASGLTEGTVLTTTPNERLTEGMPVTTD
jgi:RND family efflux transporter MFP subunit